MIWISHGAMGVTSLIGYTWNHLAPSVSHSTSRSCLPGDCWSKKLCDAIRLTRERLSIADQETPVEPRPKPRKTKKPPNG